MSITSAINLLQEAIRAGIDVAPALDTVVDGKVEVIFKDRAANVGAGAMLDRQVLARFVENVLEKLGVPDANIEMQGRVCALRFTPQEGLKDALLDLTNKILDNDARAGFIDVVKQIYRFEQRYSGGAAKTLLDPTFTQVDDEIALTVGLTTNETSLPLTLLTKNMPAKAAVRETSSGVSKMAIFSGKEALETLAKNMRELLSRGTGQTGGGGNGPSAPPRER